MKYEDEQIVDSGDGQALDSISTLDVRNVYNDFF